MQFECKVTDILNLRSTTGAATQGWVVFGEVVAAHIDKALLVDGVFDTFAAGIVLRAGGPSGYSEVRGDSRFDMRRPG